METGKMINRISNRLRRRAQTVQTALGIGSTQGGILDYILVESGRHPVYQKDIEREFGLRPPTATEMLQALEAKSLIRRIPDESDARRKRIIFTDEAARIKDTLRRQIDTSEQLLLQGITKEEQTEFMRIAAIMLQNLDK